MSQLFSLPSDVLHRVLSLLPLPELPIALGALLCSCHGGAALLDSVWTMLLPLVSHSEGAGSSSGRKSERLVLSERAAFVRAWRAFVARSEALHHAIAVAGQDEQRLTVGVLKSIISRWGSGERTLLDRASPVYNATLLMEVCKARGTREHSIVQCVGHLASLGANLNARPPGDAACTPLIIASCRGLPRLVAFLLDGGADPMLAGEGRFRLCGSSKTLHGCHAPLEWVEALLAAEEENGVPEKDRQSLAKCARILRVALQR